MDKHEAEYKLNKLTPSKRLNAVESLGHESWSIDIENAVDLLANLDNANQALFSSLDPVSIDYYSSLPFSYISFSDPSLNNILGVMFVISIFSFFYYTFKKLKNFFDINAF